MVNRPMFIVGYYIVFCIFAEFLKLQMVYPLLPYSLGRNRNKLLQLGTCDVVKNSNMCSNTTTTYVKQTVVITNLLPASRLALGST